MTTPTEPDEPAKAAGAAVPPAAGPPCWQITLAITNPAGQTVTYTATTAAQPATDWTRPSHRDPTTPALTLDAPALVDLDRAFDLAGLPVDAVDRMYPELAQRPKGQADGTA